MYIGVDTHKQTHTMVAIDEQGRFGAGRGPSATHRRAGWVATPGPATGRARTPGASRTVARWARASPSSSSARGEALVCEVSPHRTAQYRRRGRTQDKTDQTDALAIARLLVAEGGGLPLVQRDDLSTELRLVSDHRDNLLTERTRLLNQLHGQMLQLDPGYRERSGPLTKPRGLAYCRAYRPADPSGVVQARLLIVAQLAEQVARLEADIAALTGRLEHVGAGEPDAAARPARGGRRGGRPPDRRAGQHPARPLGRSAGRVVGDRPGGGLLRRPSGPSSQPGREPAAEPRHPHHRPGPAARRRAGASLLRQEDGGGQDEEGGDALPQTTAWWTCSSVHCAMQTALCPLPLDTEGSR